MPAPSVSASHHTPYSALVNAVRPWTSDDTMIVTLAFDGTWFTAATICRQ